MTFATFLNAHRNSTLIISDVLTARNAAMKQLNVAREMQFPGRKEEQFGGVSGITETAVRESRKSQQYVSSAGRDPQAIRIEIIQAAINFLEQWMNIENDETIINLKAVLDAKSPKDLITASKFWD